MWCSSVEIVELLEAGADVSEQDTEGKTAYDLCDDAEIRRLLLDNERMHVMRFRAEHISIPGLV